MSSLHRCIHPLSLLGCVLALHGCAIWPTGPQAPELRELERNRRLWQTQGAGSYRYRVENFCFCGEEYRGPVAVEVRDGSTISATYVRGGAPARPEPFGSMDTVEDLFDTVARALSRDPDEAEVAYDPLLGYPVSARFDYERHTADEEGGFSVTSFRRQ